MNDDASTMRSYASLFDGKQPGFAIFLREKAYDLEELEKFRKLFGSYSERLEGPDSLKTEPGDSKKKAKIKVGAKIQHDFGFYTWPACCPPMEEYAGEEYQYKAKDPDMLFEVEWDESIYGDSYICTAPGYGEKGKYGNGAILVRDKEGISQN